MLNYKSIPDARPFCCGVILAVRGSCHPTPRNPEYPNMLPQSVSTYADFPVLLLWLWSVQVPWAICIDYGYRYCSCRSCWRTILYTTVNKQQTSNQMQFGGGTLPFDYGDNIHLHCNAINHWHWIFVLVIIFYFLFSNLKECGDKIACLLLWKKQRWQREAIAIVFLILKTLWIGGKCLASC